jgi:hypothetical protein
MIEDIKLRYILCSFSFEAGDAGWHNLRMAQACVDANTVLRLRICGFPECRSVFTICVSCDRGQRYCGPACRSAVRRRQRRDANHRYQQSEQGREVHRRCQRRYREGATQAPVTDQTPTPITSPAPRSRCCTICGRQSLWIDPFPTIPRLCRRGRSSENYVFG